ncbi:MAG: twin-arginine translocase TatA/TatE family subunit [Acidimicrobiia bacterium]|nr:twin-arginine translocase TatA/TatE family subunit [Acidimicrobiia bacterium]
MGPDLLIVLVVVALLFGSSQLPKLARSLGSARREFEKGLADGANASGSAAPDTPAAVSPAPGSEQVTMTRAELDALIAEREAKGRTQQSG